MNGKNLRISRIFDPVSGRAVIVPVDHGLMMGSVEGLSDPIDVLKKLLKCGVDATLMGPGVGKLTLDLFEGKDKPARILTVDFPMVSTIPGEYEGVLSHEPVATVEYALRWGFDMIKVLLPWGSDRDVLSKTIKLISEFVDACDRWNMPLMIEPVLWGGKILSEKMNDPKMVENSARIAVELGADVIKLQYTGNKEQFSEIVKRLHVPILILGGPKMESVRDILNIAKEAISAGARGVVFGRNVWQNPNMLNFLKALKEVVHESAKVDDVLKRYNL